MELIKRSNTIKEYKKYLKKNNLKSVYRRNFFKAKILKINNPYKIEGKFYKICSKVPLIAKICSRKKFLTKYARSSFFAKMYQKYL